MDIFETPKAIDLFCGAGGLSLGLHQAGWDIVFANDFDKWSVKTHKVNLPNTHVELGDVKDIDFTQFNGKISLVAGGPPCQPFSVAGKQLAQQDSRDMVPEFIRAVREIQPNAFLMENVSGLLTKKNATYFTWIISEFIKLNYLVNFRLVDSATYGVPQHRKRLIIIGVNQGDGFKFPNPTNGPEGQTPYVTSGEALKDVLEDEPNGAKVVYASKPILRPSPYAGMLVNGQGRPINLARPSQTIPATAGGYRTHFIDEEGVLLKYHAHLRSGGKPFEGLVPNVRRITTKESARLQSFPDDYIFLGPKSIRYKLIGNAVPPRLGYVIGRALYEYLFENKGDDGIRKSVAQLQLF